MTYCPEVSILVTVYNRESYLEATLQSILDLTYEDFEVVVVDDCSTDQSASIAKKLAGRDHRIRFFLNESNLGDYGNRMKAASLARGKYLKYVDSDDLIYPYSLQVMVDAMEKYPDAAVGLSHSMPEDEQPYPWKLTPEETYKKHFLGRGCLSCGPTGAVIRRTAFEQVGGFRREWGVLSDTDLWIRLAKMAPIVLLPPALVWWRRHEGQEFTKEGAELDYLVNGYKLDLQHLEGSDCPLDASDQSAAIKKRRFLMARRILSTAFKQGRVSMARRMMSTSGLRMRDLLSSALNSKPKSD